MGLVYKKELEGGTQIGIWEIEEDPDYLLSKLILDEKEQQYIATLTNEQRRMHWLGSRVLVKELLGTTDQVIMGVDAHGKPSLGNFPHHITISHSNDYACVMISESHRVAVDVEYIHPKIERVAHKFMYREELDNLDIDYGLEEMYVFWCAKEVLYKIYGKRRLNFKEHIPLKPFDYPGDGTLLGSVIKDDFNQEYTIYFEMIDDYMLAYTLA
jgi:phosphopantetheinyl transferase